MTGHRLMSTIELGSIVRISYLLDINPFSFELPKMAASGSGNSTLPEYLSSSVPLLPCPSFMIFFSTFFVPSIICRCKWVSCSCFSSGFGGRNSKSFDDALSGLDLWPLDAQPLCVFAGSACSPSSRCHQGSRTRQHNCQINYSSRGRRGS